MLETMYSINFLGMILLPILAGIYLSRKFHLSWKLFLAGGLTFVASQVLHVPLVLALASIFKSWGIVAYAVTLGLLAGLFEETARYSLFRFVLKKTRTWEKGVFIGLGHGGTEAILLGFLAATAFANMLVYRNIDLSTVPSIPPEQLALAKQQVTAYWSAPVYMAILGMVERVFAICLHLSLSVMVLYSVVSKKPGWYGLAVLWHTIVDGAAVYFGQQIGMLSLEGVISGFAVISLVILFLMKPKFANQRSVSSEMEAS